MQVKNIKFGKQIRKKENVFLKHEVLIFAHADQKVVNKLKLMEA